MICLSHFRNLMHWVIYVIRGGKTWFQKTRWFLKCCLVNKIAVHGRTVAKAMVIIISFNFSQSLISSIARFTITFTCSQASGFASLTVTIRTKFLGKPNRAASALFVPNIWGTPWRWSLSLTPFCFHAGAILQAKTLRIRELNKLSQARAFYVAA